MIGKVPPEHNYANITCSLNCHAWGSIVAPICSCESQSKPVNPELLQDNFDWVKKQIEDLHALVTDLRCENKELKSYIKQAEQHFQDCIDKIRYDNNGRIEKLEQQKLMYKSNLMDDAFERIKKLESYKHYCVSQTRLEILENFYNEMKEKMDKFSELDILDEIQQQITPLNLRITNTINFFENVFFDRIKKLEEHHVRQIDENRKISKRVDEIESITNNLPKNEILVVGRLGQELIKCETCKGHGIHWKGKSNAINEEQK